MLKIALPLVEIASSTNNYIEALVRSGALPMLGEGLRPEVCDGLLLPGGVDVDPSLYGQEKDPTTEFEQALESESLTGMDVRQALRSLSKLLNIIYDGHFESLTREITMRI